MNKKYDVLKTIADKSWDHGLNFELAGKFENKKELEKLLSENGLDIDYSEDLLNESIGYAEIFGEDIDTIQVENGNELWLVKNELSTFDGLCDKLYKDQKGNYLLGFAYDTFDIHFAIDLLTGTVGTINFDNDGNAIYDWKHTLHSDDIEMMQRIIDENDLSLDASINITRK